MYLRFSLAIFGLLLSLQCHAAFNGQIPEVDKVLDVDSDGDWLDWTLSAGDKILTAIGIGIGVIGFLKIAKSALKIYGDIDNDRATWFDLGGHIVGGIALLAFIFFGLAFIAG